MANHCQATMPWTPKWDVFGAFSQELMKAAFGPAYALEGDLSGGDSAKGDLTWNYLSEQTGIDAWIWKSGPRTVEIRRSARGLGGVAIDLLLEGCSQAFGAAKACDEGIGDYPIGEVGILVLGSRRMFHGGMAGSARMKRLGEGSWGISGAPFDRLVPLMDPVFFKAPVSQKEMMSLTFGSDPDAHAKMRADCVHWLDRLDWPKALESLWGSSKAPDRASAESAALPFCALGLELPMELASQMGKAGAQRALSVALLWKSAPCARLLSKIHPGLDIEAAKAWALKSVRVAHVHESSPWAAAAALSGISELAQAIELSCSVAKPAKARAKGGPAMGRI